VQQRIAGSGGHLSNRAAAELLAEVHHPGLSVVVLAHLSERCNTAAEARAAVETALRRVGFRGTVYVAEQDAPLPAIDVRPGVLELPLAL
jgi:phosphoribosyl 1,2-cyclic phosphodiesterase